MIHESYLSKDGVGGREISLEETSGQSLLVGCWMEVGPRRALPRLSLAHWLQDH